VRMGNREFHHGAPGQSSITLVRRGTGHPPSHHGPRNAATVLVPVNDTPLRGAYGIIDRTCARCRSEHWPDGKMASSTELENTDTGASAV
jgi:hypothetical protein